MKHLIVLLLLTCFQVRGQEIDSKHIKLVHLIQELRFFAKSLPQEKVYLHFDNTSYYQGDHIWFKCYVVTAEQHQLSRLSKTLYVELLNPGGEIVDKRTLRIENGQCHSSFTLNQIPFYSGFYEVRAYTKYMLNFGEDVIFSRLLPVFNKPKTEGNFEEKEMLRYGRRGVGNYAYQMKRERPERGKAVNLRFFPEGGDLVLGVTSRVAFEVTDEGGNPIEVTGVVMDADRQELCQIATLHEGRGVFSYTPAAGKRKAVAVVEYAGKKYQFDLPESLPQGVVMETDNLSNPDSIAITLRKNGDTPSQLLGVAVLYGGKIQNYCIVDVVEDEIGFAMDKTQLPSGVSRIVLFNDRGEILCDRLVFTCKKEWLEIKAQTDKPSYKPYELVNMEIAVTDWKANPVQATFSLSVRDGANEVESKHSVLTDLLLMSEIKGYVRNPSYYFEEDDDSSLDVLLMVQGWRRYSWKQMTGIEPFELKYRPEQGIETHGNVVTFLRQKPRSNVDVSLMLHQKNEEEDLSGCYLESFVTDDQGRFAFSVDVEGRWNMILSVAEKGKAKDHRIILDRVFSPEPRKYRFADLQVSYAENSDENGNMNDETDDDIDDDIDDDVEEDVESIWIAYKDSLAKSGMDEKVLQLEEVTVKAKRGVRMQDIFRNRSTSIAYYDVASEYDDVYDRGEYVGNNIHELLKNMNPHFTAKVDEIRYKNKHAVFVVNYEPVIYMDTLSMFAYQHINIQAIKSIYINETMSAMCKYLTHPHEKCIKFLNEFSCVVFIETYPEGQVSVEGSKGVRKTWLTGYSAASEFYSPDYSSLPLESDCRRTLYWNPSVTPDENGNANIKFYNNSSSKSFKISAETITQSGIIGFKR